MEVTIEHFMPKNEEEREGYLDTSYYKNLSEYFEEEYPLEFMVIPTKEVNDILLLAAVKYQFRFSKWLTNGGEKSAAREVAWQDAIEHIQGAVQGVVKYDD